MHINELIDIVVQMDEDHNNSCPWHEEKQPAPGRLGEQLPNEDVDELQKNASGVLTSSLEGVGCPRPNALDFQLAYERDTTVPVRINGKNKQMQLYKESDSPEMYHASYAAHHIIPGNETLKGHPVVGWMGGEPEVKDYGRDEDGKPTAGEIFIKPGEFIGYNINAAENGIWLPGPYPLSTKGGKWPSEEGLEQVGAAGTSSSQFKAAYARTVMGAARKQYNDSSEAMQTYIGCQLHFRHSTYSERLKLALRKIFMLTSHFSDECPKFKNQDPPPDKYPAPLGLKAKLENVSYRMRRYLVGPIYNKLIYTDEQTRRVIRGV